MTLRKWELDTYIKDRVYFAATAQYAEYMKTGFTALANDGVVCSAGATKVFGGTYEVWAYTSTLIEKYRRPVHEAAKKLLESTFSIPSVRRMQASVNSEHPAAVRWIEHLGFEFEGTLKRYGVNGEDFLMYARVK